MLGGCKSFQHFLAKSFIHVNSWHYYLAKVFFLAFYYLTLNDIFHHRSDSSSASINNLWNFSNLFEPLVSWRMLQNRFTVQMWHGSKTFYPPSICMIICSLRKYFVMQIIYLFCQKKKKKRSFLIQCAIQTSYLLTLDSLSKFKKFIKRIPLDWHQTQREPFFPNRFHTCWNFTDGLIFREIFFIFDPCSRFNFYCQWLSCLKRIYLFT